MKKYMNFTLLLIILTSFQANAKSKDCTVSAYMYVKSNGETSKANYKKVFTNTGDLSGVLESWETCYRIAISEARRHHYFGKIRATVLEYTQYYHPVRDRTYNAFGLVAQGKARWVSKIVRSEIIFKWTFNDSYLPFNLPKTQIGDSTGYVTKYSDTNPVTGDQAVLLSD